MPGRRAEGSIAANISIEKALWDAAMAKARSQGRALSDVIREFLRQYTSSEDT